MCSCTITGIDADFKEVYLTCKGFSANWEDIAISLGIKKSSIEIIARDNPNKVTGCMSDVIATWLRRESLQQQTPTWRNLCIAIANANKNAVVERIGYGKRIDTLSAGRSYK